MLDAIQTCTYLFFIGTQLYYPFFLKDATGVQPFSNQEKYYFWKSYVCISILALKMILFQIRSLRKIKL